MLKGKWLMQGKQESLMGLIVVPDVCGYVFPVLPAPPSFLQTSVVECSRRVQGRDYLGHR